MKNIFFSAVAFIVVCLFVYGCEQWDLEKLDITCPKVINLSGNLNFGNVEVPPVSPPSLILRITNSGTCPLTVFDIGTPTGFSGNLNATTSIVSNQFIDIVIDFNPTQVGPYQGIITINSDATSGISSIAVTGAGINTSIGGNGILAVSGDVDFGSVQLNSPAIKTFTLSNQGDATLTIDSIHQNYSDIYTITGISTSFDINANGNKQVTLTMNTSEVGSYYDTITIFSSVNDKTIYISGEVVNAGSGSCPIQFIDTRDSETYHAKLFHGQCWMKENLRFNSDSSEADIPFENNPANLSVNGRFYPWEVAMNFKGESSSIPSGVQGVCPEGWHLPSIAEWESLFGQYSNENMAYQGLIEGGSSEIGFNLYGYYSGSSWILGSGLYWTTEDNNLSLAWVAGFYGGSETTDINGSTFKDYLLPCRCIKD